MNDRRAYSPHEVALLLGCSRRTIYNRLHDGSLRSVVFGNRRLIPSEELERVLRVDG